MTTLENSSRLRVKLRLRAWIAGGLALLAALGAGGYVAYRSTYYAFPLFDAQRATISPEATAIMERSHILMVPDFVVPLLATRESIIAGQASFAAGERPHEEELIAHHGLSVDEIEIGGVPVVVITPPAIRPGFEDVVIFNIHGGSFVLGSARDRVALLLAHDVGVPVYSVEYDLAPEAPFPIAIEQGLAVYRELTMHVPADRILATGASSGGNQVLSILHRARDAGLPMPAALGLFTPAADLTGVGDSAIVNNGRDGLIVNFGRNLVDNFYAPGMDVADPGISPIYADYGPDFPPTVISIGTRDLLLSNAVRLDWKLEEAGVRRQLLISEGMWHGFNWEPDLPEAIAARAAVARFLIEHVRTGEEN
jgi:Esterase/lipase